MSMRPLFMHSQPQKGLQKGFSLVELMVAIAIGLILVAGLATLFANSSKTGNDLERSIRQIENGRYAAELLNEDISIAGYYGELSTAGMTFSNPSECTVVGAISVANLGWGVNGGTVTTAITGLNPTEAATQTCLSNYKTGTQALAVRHLDTQRITPTVALIAGNVHVQTSRCIFDPNATKFVISTTASDFTLRKQNCTASSTEQNEVQRYISRIYYIASCNECSGSGQDTIPTLKYAELRGTAMVVVPLVEGIEDLAFDHGFDTNSDGAPDTYSAGTALSAASDWKNVTGIRTHILSRSTDANPGFTDPKTYALGLSGTRGPFSDTFKRRAYTSTTRINNVAGPREIP